MLALTRREFFQIAEFYGGTALRILYGLHRFSEGLDFALLVPDVSFNLAPYLLELANEFREFGYERAGAARAVYEVRTCGSVRGMRRKPHPTRLRPPVVDIEVTVHWQTDTQFMDDKFD